MPESQNQNQKQTKLENIIKTYRLIHTYFFTYAIFFVAISIGAIIFQNKLTASMLMIQTNQTNYEFIIKQKELIGTFNKQLKQNSENEGIQTRIIQGHIDSTGDYISSANNLAIYKGYILPRFFYVYKTLPLQEISYFSQKDYEPRELDVFIQNVLLAKAETNQKQEENIQLPLKGTIIETFDLGCMYKSKFYQTICNQHIENFLNNFFVYRINQDYEGLKKVFNTIAKKDKYKNLLCENMNKYIGYSNDTNTTTQELIAQCDAKSLENFIKLASFVEVQKQLDSRQINKTVYNDNEINAYKLLSIQQNIYKDIINNRASATNITQYINFLKELLTIDKIDSFYKDLIYRFNNKYILPRIENPDSPIAKNRKSEADEIIKQITIINNGSELLGFKGLIYQTRNEKLLPKQIQSITQTTNTEKEIAILLNHITYLKTREVIYSGQDILINGDLIINDPEIYNNKIKLNAALLLRYQQNEFMVKKIKIVNQDTMNAVIKTILSKAEYSLQAMQEYIDQNFAFYNKTSQTDTTNLLCNQIKNKITVDPNIQINACTADTLLFTRTTDNNTINYKIEFTNYVVTNITISDPEIQTTIQEQLQKISTNEVNFADVLSSIVSYTKPETTVATNEGTNNTIIVTEQMKKYLGIGIDDIAEKNGKILIAFNVGGIKFIGNYNITKHIIYPIYFKEVLLNKLPAKIMNFSLSLDDTNKTDIYNFISNPEDYIKTISPESYLLYSEFISQGQ